MRDAIGSAGLRRLLLGIALCLCAPSLCAAGAGTWRPSKSAGIYNGVETTEHAAVAKLLLGYPRSTGLCSGTLIAPSIVLTAAHCLSEGLVGVNAVFSVGASQVSYEAERFAVHPDYAPSLWPLADIALIFLGRPVTEVSPMPVALESPPPRSRGVVVGFGDDETKQAGQKRMGNVKLRRCPRRALRAARLEAGRLEQSLCWRPRRHHADTCRGDSGGPPIVDGAVAGVTSGGYPDCHGRLSWNSNVALFRGWIDEQAAGA